MVLGEQVGVDLFGLDGGEAVDASRVRSLLKYHTQSTAAISTLCTLAKAHPE